INKLILTPSRAHQNQQEDTSGESTCDISRTSSSGGIDEIHDFDPDAVDFEPLLVTGSGKILSYHSESFYESEENNSVSSSVATPIARNSNHDHERRA
ncbi:hypothetical protein ACHAXH_008385, partial [Discostella pseudostelligera]